MSPAHRRAKPARVLVLRYLRNEIDYHHKQANIRNMHTTITQLYLLFLLPLITFLLAGCAGPSGSFDPNDAVSYCSKQNELDFSHELDHELGMLTNFLKAQSNQEENESDIDLNDILKTTRKFDFESKTPLGDFTPGIKYGQDGHLDATAMVAMLAGLQANRQFALSYYSRYPDFDYKFTAIQTSLYNSIRPWRWHWLCDVNSKLHALHGGGRKEIDTNRNNIILALKETLKSKELDWISGILIHSLADTYAHTKNKFNSSEEKAYGCFFGHAWDGKRPDIITYDDNSKLKFSEYLDTLYKILSEVSGNQNPLSSWYLETIKAQLKDCDTEECPNFHSVTFRWRTEKAPDHDLRVKQFQECMDSVSRPMSESEVQQMVMDRF